MIRQPPGWTRRHAGDAILMHLGGDEGRGFVRYVEHIAPVAAPLELLAAQLACDPEFEVGAIATPIDLVTHEGEHAAMVTVHGRLDGVPVQRDIGWVYGDAHVARISAMTHEEPLFPLFTRTVRDLLLADEQHLGVRRRRFRHAAPRGWRARTRGFATAVYDAPDGRAQIEVEPAVPWSAGVEEAAAQLEALSGSGGLVIERREGPYPVIARDGLSGRVWSLTCRQDGSRFRRRAASLVDDRYLYCLRADTIDGGDDGAFDAVLSSIESVPRPRRRRPESLVDVVSHWC